MIGWLMLFIVAVLGETTGLLFPTYLIFALVLYLRSTFARTVGLVAIAGLVLDVVTPRPLGLSPLIMLVILLIFEKFWGTQKEKGVAYYLLGLILVVSEGLLVGRGATVIVIQLVLFVIVAFIMNSYLAQRFSKQLIVRRTV